MGSFEKAAIEHGRNEQKNTDIMIVRLRMDGLSSEEIASRLKLDPTEVSDFLAACKIPA